MNFMLLSAFKTKHIKNNKCCGKMSFKYYTFCPYFAAFQTWTQPAAHKEWQKHGNLYTVQIILSVYIDSMYNRNLH